MSTQPLPELTDDSCYAVLPLSGGTQPQHPQALCNSGVVYRELDRLEEAVAAYEAALVVSAPSDWTELDRLAGWLLGIKSWRYDHTFNAFA